MTIGVGNLISAIDYTTIKADVDLIYGTGALQKGYGQTITSPAVSAGQPISHVEWNALRNDMVACRQHQTNAIVGNLHPADFGYVAGLNLIIPTAASTISQVLTQQYADFATIITNRRFSVDVSQQTVYALDTHILTTEWNNTITHSVVITDTYDNLRYFFNSGGTINFSASIVGSTGTLKDVSWNSILGQVGIVSMNHNIAVDNTGFSTPGTVGFAYLATTDSLIYQRAGAAGTEFASNTYSIYARLDNITIPTIITFTIEFADNDTTGADINVTGTLTSVVTQSVATGPNVSVAQLTASASSLTGGTPVPQYSISPSTTVVSEGSSITFNITSQYVTNGTTIYWKNIGTSLAARFTDSLNSGSFTISGNIGSFVKTVLVDTSIHPLETIIIQLYTDSAMTILAGLPGPTVSINPSGTVAITTAGATTFTVPANVFSVSVTLYGGGGGSGLAAWDAYPGFGNFNGDGMPGGNGSIVAGTLSVTPGQNITTTVGAGGAAAVYLGQVTGYAGGSSTIGTYTASGGTGGAYGGNFSNLVAPPQLYGCGGAGSASNYTGQQPGQDGAILISWV